MGSIIIAAVGDIAILKRPEGDLFKPEPNDFDLFIGNLEGPIISTPGLPAEKPIRLRLPKETAPWLKEIGVDAVSLANNHILDWGVDGLFETMTELEKAGIRYCGAGIDDQVAGSPIIFDINGFKVALLSWAATVPSGFKALPNRPGIAGIKVRTSFIVDTDMDEQPGTPPWVCTEAMVEDLQSMGEAIRYATTEADFTILSIHWGVPPKESNAGQGPIADYQAQIIERAVECGAGLLLGHHCHTPLGMQIYNGVPVLYSLGNYIFNCDFLPHSLDITPSPVPYNYIPHNKDSCFVRIELAAEEHGPLQVRRVEIIPCTLNNYCEAVAASPEMATEIAGRIYNFSLERNADVSIERDVLVWKTQ